MLKRLHLFDKSRLLHHVFKSFPQLDNNTNVMSDLFSIKPFQLPEQLKQLLESRTSVTVLTRTELMQSLCKWQGLGLVAECKLLFGVSSSLENK